MLWPVDSTSRKEFRQVSALAMLVQRYLQHADRTVQQPARLASVI